LTALAKCETRIVGGKLAAGTDCTTEEKTSAALTKAANKLRAGIARACGGSDRACGGGDDEPLAGIGWNVVTCPDYRSAGCTNPITDCTGIGDCIVCVDTAAVATILGLANDALDLGSPAGSAVERCQIAIGKEAARYEAAKLRALALCWRAVGKGAATSPCPLPGDGKAAVKIAKAESAKIRKICKACGGADRACDATIGPIPGSGGADDLTPGMIGFAPACLDVTAPVAASTCTGPIADLADAVACLDCVADHSSECADALAVPWAQNYPVACNPTPSAHPTLSTPTPSPTSTSTAATPTATSATPTATPTPDPCAGFADSFGGASLDPSWNVLHPSLVTIAVGGGALSLTATTSGGSAVWFNDGEGPFVYKTITGDFTVTTVAHAEDPANPGQAPPTQYRLGGLLVRDPGGGPGTRNSAHVALGAGDVAHPVTVEDKTTVASSSNYLFYSIPTPDIELRITRSGTTIDLYYRAIGAGTWTFARSHAHPELPATIQVGMMVYAVDAPPSIRVDFDEITCSSP
jgi:hypothetical protein